jgi:hypothetical protein
MRIVDPVEKCVGFRLNLIGLRVYGGHCQLVGRRGNAWEPIGPPRDLPLELPDDVTP